MKNPFAWLRRLYGGDIKTGLTVAGTGTLGQINRVSAWLLWVIVSVVFALLLWAYFTEVETVARSQGKVIPSAKLQVVQNYEGGVVSAIHVRAGQAVQQGDLLISLNEKQFDGDLQSRRQQMGSLEARLARLTAESTGTTPAFSAAVKKEAREFVDLDPDTLAATVRAKVIVDGRNCLDSTRWKGAGWKYHALGRRVG